MAFGDGLKPKEKCSVCSYLLTLDPAEREIVVGFIANDDFGHKSITEEVYREHGVVLSESSVSRHRRHRG